MVDMIRRSTPQEAARDERDIFEQTANATFAANFGVGDAAAKEPGTTSFSDWWSKDSTQEKFQGIMGAIGASFTGLAGIPLGGGDMSSMERAGVRAAEAPGRARQMIREKQFHRYIDHEMANTTDPRRRDMLMAVRTNPTAAAQYLAMESPASKLDRAKELEKVKHEYKMAEIALENEGRSRGVTANRADDIGTANQMYLALSEEDQKGLRERGEIPFAWFDNTAAINLIPHLYSPNGGILSGQGGEFPFDLNSGGSGTVTNPVTGKKTTIGWKEKIIGAVAEQWDNLSEYSRRWWDYVIRRDELELSDAEKAAREEAGLR